MVEAEAEVVRAPVALEMAVGSQAAAALREKEG